MTTAPVKDQASQLNFCRLHGEFFVLQASQQTVDPEACAFDRTSADSAEVGRPMLLGGSVPQPVAASVSDSLKRNE